MVSLNDLDAQLAELGSSSSSGSENASGAEQAPVEVPQKKRKLGYIMVKRN